MEDHPDTFEDVKARTCEEMRYTNAPPRPFEAPLLQLEIVAQRVRDAF